MNEFNMQVLPPEDSAGSAGRWRVRVSRAGGRSFALSLAGGNGATALSAAQAVAILADLLRPGWDERAELMDRPLVVGREVLRGFVLERTSSVAPGTWTLRYMSAVDLDGAFSWAHESAEVAAFHDAIAGSGEARDV
jgi:hypothetical protein